jgi:hypothetical protein
MAQTWSIHIWRYKFVRVIVWFNLLIFCTSYFLFRTEIHILYYLNIMLNFNLLRLRVNINHLYIILSNSKENKHLMLMMQVFGRVWILLNIIVVILIDLGTSVVYVELYFKLIVELDFVDAVYLKIYVNGKSRIWLVDSMQ